MSRKLILILWIAAVFIAGVLLVLFGGQLLLPFVADVPPAASSELSSQQSGLTAVGSEAPDFELTDLAGDRVRLSDFAHTPLLVTFWSTRDADGRDQIKILDDWITAHPDALFDILTVNSMEERSVVASFISRGGYAPQVLLDTSGAILGLYGARTLPASFFIDGNGVIRGTFVGIMSQQMIEKKSEQIIH